MGRGEASTADVDNHCDVSGAPYTGKWRFFSDSKRSQSRRLRQRSLRPSASSFIFMRVCGMEVTTTVSSKDRKASFSSATTTAVQMKNLPKKSSPNGLSCSTSKRRGALLCSTDSRDVRLLRLFSDQKVSDRLAPSRPTFGRHRFE